MSRRLQAFRGHVELDKMTLTVRGALPPGQTSKRRNSNVAIVVLVLTVALCMGLGSIRTGAAIAMVGAGLLKLYRSTAADLEEHVDTVLVLTDAGLTIEGDETSETLRPQRIGRASLKLNDRGDRFVALAVLYPPNILEINAALHEEKDVLWLIEQVNSRYAGDEGEEMKRTSGELNSLRKRTERD